MNILVLPEPIADYFATDPHDPDALARCFTASAVVTDDGHSHTGLEAIEAWRAAASARYTYTTRPFALDNEAQAHVVHARVAGNFAGSPVDLRYRFRLQRGLIASLEITA